MARIIKGRQMSARYYKGREVLKEYKQGRLVYEKSTSIPDYLCFTALEAGQFTLTIPAAVTATYLSYVEWSKDGRNWTHTDITSSIDTIDVQVASGDKVYWRGSGIRMGTSASNTATTDSIFTATGDFEVSGNIMSLLYGNSFDGVTSLPIGSEYTFAGLFYNNKKLLSIAGLSLPATALVKGCYASTFYGCSNMTGMLSSLPATSYPMSACYMMFRLCSKIDAVPSLTFVSGNGGYQFQYMFDRCTSLVDASAIVMSASDTYSFSAMFTGCSALAVTPVMSISTLKTGCFNITFQGCTNLNYVKCLATDIYATNCLNNWLSGVSSTGTFIQAEGVTWPRGASGIPTGWLAYDEGEQIPNDYTPCDYIYNSSQSGGGVDLGFKFRILDYSVEAKFKQDDISNGMVIGTYTNNSGTIWFYNYSVAGSFRINACYSGGWKYNVNGFVPLDTNTHIIRYVGDADGCYQISDGKQSGIHDISTWAAEESTDRLFIFGRSQSQNTYKGRIYYLKVWNTATEEVICNLIPCSRKSDGAAGYWDTAQKQFFTSTYWTAHNDNE